jgi:hypothetical protein
MRNTRKPSILILALSIFIAGCGKTQEEQKLENDKSSAVAALRKDVGSNLAGLADLQSRLDSTLKMHNELATKYARKMKGHTADDISAAKQGLEAAKSEAQSALNALTTYDKNMDHQQAMQKLSQDEQSLTKVKDAIAGAMSAANAALENHDKIMSGLTSKTPAKPPAKKAASRKARK